MNKKIVLLRNNDRAIILFRNVQHREIGRILDLEVPVANLLRKLVETVDFSCYTSQGWQKENTSQHSASLEIIEKIRLCIRRYIVLQSSLTRNILFLQCNYISM